MAIPLPNLDDRQFDDLVDEMRGRIARYAPEWTNHNIADPGIMLLELFAWLTEATIYRINRVPEESRVRFIQMLGGAFESAQPALWKMEVCAPRELNKPYTLARGSFLTVTPRIEQQPLTFETLHAVSLTPEVRRLLVTTRQTTQVAHESLGTSNGKDCQLFELAQSAIVLPATPYPIHPVITIKDEIWQYTPRLTESPADAAYFTIKPWLNVIAFGDGKHGRIPARGDQVLVTYRSTPTIDGIEQNEDVGDSNGNPFQHFALKKPILTLDLQALDSLEPKVLVDGKVWRYRASLSAMGCEAQEFTVEPWRNAIRFGNGVHGKVPPDGATIQATYRYTIRPIRTIPDDAHLSVINAAQDDSMAGKLVISAPHMSAAGSDSTSLEQARDVAMTIIKPRWRAIAIDDFETLVKQSNFGIARAKCLPGRNIDQPTLSRSWPGHISITVVPHASYTLQRKVEEISEILAFRGEGASMIGLNSRYNGRFWDLSGSTGVQELGAMTTMRQATFSANGQRLITVNDDLIPYLRDGNSGKEITKLPVNTSVRFSPLGTYLVAISDSGDANLRDVDDGNVLIHLSQTGAVADVLFAHDDTLLAAAGTNMAGTNHEVNLWATATGIRGDTLPHPQPISAMLFSRDSQYLITASVDGIIRLWRTDNGRQPVLLHQNAVATDLILSEDGTRLVVRAEEKAWLWSMRSKRQMADLVTHAAITSVYFSPDGKWLAVIEDGSLLRLWDAHGGTSVGERNLGATVHQVVFSPNSKMLVILSGSFTITQWELRSVDKELTPIVEKTSHAATLSHSGVWYGFAEGSLLQISLLQIWGIEEKKQISALYHDHSDGLIERVAVIANGKYLYSVATNDRADSPMRTIRVWNAEHVFDADALLKQRRLVTSQHHVSGPQYSDVYVRATVTRRSPFKLPEQLQQEISNHALSEFFHPLRGGVDGTGWQWGRAVYASEVYQILEKIEGVDHVESLTLSLSSDSGTPVEEGGAISLSIQPFHLVNYVVNPQDISVSGQVQIRPQQVTYRTS